MDLNEIFAEAKTRELAGAVFGSRARQAAGNHSDYDILIVSRFVDEGRFFFLPSDRLSEAAYRICIFYRTLDQALTSVTAIDEDWPVRNAMFCHPKVIFDHIKVFPLILREMEGVTEQAIRLGFEDVARHAFEYLAKVRNLRGVDRTKECSRRFVDKLARALAIYHRHIFIDYCDYVDEICRIASVSVVNREVMRGLAGYLDWDEYQMASGANELWTWFQTEHALD
jgi:hypothetical protein